MKKTSLLIVEDHQLLRQTWSFILNSKTDYEVKGECSNAKEAIGLTTVLQPDIIILDINLPGMTGLEALPELLKFSPASKILAVSMHNQPLYVRKMIKAGAMGYVCKNSSSNEMFVALEEIRNGKKYICQSIKEALAKQVVNNEGENKPNGLSQRELDIIRHLKDGSSSKEIAQMLSIATKTVEAHRFI